MKNELVKVNGVEIEVQPDVEHEWLLSTKDVADGYGLSESGLRSVKSEHSDELEEGKHWVLSESRTKLGGRPSVMWTKRGVVRLGFFIKTPMAKEFRDWAEDYIVNERAPKAQKEVRLTPAEMLLQQAQLMLEMERKTSELDKRVVQLEAKNERDGFERETTLRNEA